MSYKSKGSSLPPLEDSSLSGRSPRQRRRKTSYEYKSGSSSPTTPSPRSPFGDKDSPRQRNAESKCSPRTPGKDANKEYRPLCIGSPIPDTDPHAEDMVLTAEKRGKPARNKGQRTPAITIDKVEELHLVDSKSPRGGRPISPASYELIEHSRSTTPFSKSRSTEKLLSIEPSTPPVERKGNRQVINYYRDKDGDVNRSRSDGNLPDSAREFRRGNGETRKHARSHTEGNRSEGSRGSRDKSPGRRDLTPSPRLTRRARENEQSFSSSRREGFRERRGKSRDDEQARSSSPEEVENRRRDLNDRQRETPKQRGDRNHRRDGDERRGDSPPRRNRHRNRKYSNDSDSEEISPRSPRDEVKKPVRLEPLNLSDKKK